MYHQTMWQVVQDRHNELLKVAESRQLVSKTQAERFNRQGRFALNVGDFVASLGAKLKTQRLDLSKEVQ